ncbi:MAG: DEAD/DEAH box helicase [Candidatus Pacearchaeota archaeon]|jgi:ATP-dependent RNA helicase DeaD
MEQFQKLGLSAPLLRVIQEEKFEKPSEIQEKSIPLVLAGKDVIAGASTGSGKTLAFGSAILQNTKKDYGIQALVLTPTRELAEQISQALRKFSKHNPLKILPVYGGVSINNQIDDLEYAEVVVGTPGRILDHINKGTIDLRHIKILVLDEADRMLDMGFIDDVDNIIQECPGNRQTLLFSATISEDISRLAKKYMIDPVRVTAEQFVDPKKLTQVFYDVEDYMKFSLLVNLLKNEDSHLVMIFCNTRRNVDFVANNLKYNKIYALPIHGGFSQAKRTKVMETFNANKTTILVCTDVAARGLDIKGVSHVYNYDIPQDSKEYIHRIGRTARAGKEGKVINIVSSRDYENFNSLIESEGIQIKQEENPYIEKAEIAWKGGNDRERGNSRFDRGSGRSRPRPRNDDYSDRPRRHEIGGTRSFSNDSNDEAPRRSFNDNERPRRSYGSNNDSPRRSSRGSSRSSPRRSFNNDSPRRSSRDDRRNQRSRSRY